MKDDKKNNVEKQNKIGMKFVGNFIGKIEKAPKKKKKLDFTKK